MMKAIPKQYHIYIFLAIFYLLWAIRVFIIWPWPNHLDNSPEIIQILGEILRVTFWLGPVVIYFKLTSQEAPLDFLRITSPINATWLWTIVLGSTIYLVGLLFIDQYDFELEMNVFVQVTLKIMLAPLIEEIVFRGFVLRMFEQQYCFWVANLLQTCFFGAAHFFWLYLHGFNWNVAGMFTFAIVIGGVWGFMTQKTNSILPGTIYHIVNNILSLYKI